MGVRAGDGAASTPGLSGDLLTLGDGLTHGDGGERSGMEIDDGLVGGSVVDSDSREAGAAGASEGHTGDHAVSQSIDSFAVAQTDVDAFMTTGSGLVAVEGAGDGGGAVLVEGIAQVGSSAGLGGIGGSAEVLISVRSLDEGVLVSAGDGIFDLSEGTAGSEDHDGIVLGDGAVGVRGVVTAVGGHGAGSRSGGTGGSFQDCAGGDVAGLGLTAGDGVSDLSVPVGDIEDGQLIGGIDGAELGGEGGIAVGGGVGAGDGVALAGSGGGEGGGEGDTEHHGGGQDGRDDLLETLFHGQFSFSIVRSVWFLQFLIGGLAAKVGNRL